MGYDIGFHSVDLEDITSAFDYVFGNSDSLDYAKRAIIAGRSRFIANAWGLGVLQIKSELFGQCLDQIDAEVKNNTPGILGKLLGKKAPKPDYKNIDLTQTIGSFDSDVHVWGRPFLIADEQKIDVLIKHYMCASSEEVERIAHGQIKVFNPSLLSQVKRDGGKIPDDREVLRNAKWKLDIMRKAVSKFPSSFSDSDGNEHDSKSLLENELNFVVLESVSIVNPTWMDRGTIWPSLLFSNIDINPSYFRSFSELYSDGQFLPKISFRKDKTIRDNFSVGTVVLPSDVQRFREDLAFHRHSIVQFAQKDGWDFHCEQVLQKIDECTNFAIKHNHAFVESSDIFSGPLGVIT